MSWGRAGICTVFIKLIQNPLKSKHAPPDGSEIRTGPLEITWGKQLALSWCVGLTLRQPAPCTSWAASWPGRMQVPRATLALHPYGLIAMGKVPRPARSKTPRASDSLILSPRWKSICVFRGSYLLIPDALHSATRSKVCFGFSRKPLGLLWLGLLFFYTKADIACKSCWCPRNRKTRFLERI